MAETKNTSALDNVEDMNPQHIPVIEIVNPKKEYPAGMIVDMTINVYCPEGCDLSGGTILIGDENDHVIAEQILISFDEDEEVNTTDSFSVQIPKETGDYTWTIVFYPFESDFADANITDADSADAEFLTSDETNQSGKTPATREGSLAALHAITQADYSFKAVQHITGMSVWRESLVPVPIGSEYPLRIGVSCIHGCSLLGQKVNVYHNDTLLASVVMEEPMAPLEGLYQNTVTLTAPNEVGMYVLKCHLEPEGLDLSHTSNTHKFALTTNKHAQCRLDLTALSAEDGTPLGYADFVVQSKDAYPGYVRTGEDGKASIGALWGDVHIEVNCDERRDVQTDITIPEGQEVYELTLTMPWQPRILD